jgi:hypothetical protein
MVLPRAWFNPADGMDAPCLTLARVHVVADVAATSDTEITLTLAGWSAPRLEMEKRKTSNASGDGLNAVDAWAVQSGWQKGAPFTPQAIASRGKRHPLAMQLTAPRMARGSLLIKAWDGFGQEGTTVLQLSSPAGVGGKAMRKRS